MLGRTDAGTDFRASLPVRRQLLHLLPPSRLPPLPTLPISPPLCASMLCFVAPQLAALLAPTNLFLTLITARQQAAVQWAGQMKGSNLPITGGLLFSPPSFLVGAISDRTTMDLRFLFFLVFFIPSSALG